MSQYSKVMLDKLAVWHTSALEDLCVKHGLVMDAISNKYKMAARNLYGEYRSELEALSVAHDMALEKIRNVHAQTLALIGGNPMEVFLESENFTRFQQLTAEIEAFKKKIDDSFALVAEFMVNHCYSVEAQQAGERVCMQISIQSGSQVMWLHQQRKKCIIKHLELINGNLQNDSAPGLLVFHGKTPINFYFDIKQATIEKLASFQKVLDGQ